MKFMKLLLITGTAIGLIAGSAPIVGSLLGTSAVAVAQTPANDIDQVRQQWVQAFNTKNLQAIVAQYDEDAVLMPPTGERIVGKEKLTEYFKQIFASASRLTINSTSDKTDTSGDLGFDGGHYEETVVTSARPILSGNVTVSGNVTISGGGGTQSLHRGSYLVVLKRLTGKWLIVQQAITEVPQTGK